jgi:hypothetical protein
MWNVNVGVPTKEVDRLKVTGPPTASALAPQTQDFGMSRWQLSNKLYRLPRARKGARWRILVESRCGAVALGRTYLLPPLSSGGALVVPPWLRFHIPLIEPDRQISRIRLSDKTSRFRVQRHLQLLNIYWS